MDLSLFFAPETRVFTLPGPRNPRLYLPTQRPLQRWDQSALYPASRLTARLYRLLLRLNAASGLMQARTIRSAGWPLRTFVQDAVPSLASVVILIGTPTPAQRMTAQLWDGNGRVIGYVKYAEKAAARRRMRQEWSVLQELPEKVGPKPLKYGPLGRGVALLTSPVAGRPPSPRPTPSDGWINLLESLLVSPPVPLERHPWVLCMREKSTPGFDNLLEPLASREWPVTVQHGDFVPWNLLEGREAGHRAIDWEYGTLQGFPYLDLVHYVLQVLGLLRRRAPEAAGRYVAAYLSQQGRLTLNENEARALTRLAAYDAYVKSVEDGKSPDTGLQPWRKAIWEGKPWVA
ncbi:hypothetical protein GBA63_18310 [Rubrobacter tropicus]|uniref:Aminoglycoside phosphotransferase domain-containing protein n=1 Tax=Rubrobacter tropicus TaxID=2653851 RepID=A0A6G8QD01_9ACTN|nr:hypothetical protein [Rubrobacter tropicus]QIN84375.1 hypothetical protein GBA63_18310 [Rubrobacter tropicus]